ncbi:MAG: transporter [Flavobacterium sp.]|nr:transporter [Flavobacterium sp.]
MKNICKVFMLVLPLVVYAGEFDSIQTPNYKQMFSRLLLEDCDACGCSANGGSMGFSSLLTTNFVGMRYVYQSYNTKQGIFANSPWIEEHFNTWQIWARIPLTSKIQLSLLMPYHQNNRNLLSGNEQIKGFGDATMMGLYTVFQTQKDSTIWVHKIQVGTGVKLPTGKNTQLNNGTLNPSFQLGTGSWDYLFLSEYVVKRKKLGLNTSLNYTFKTENDSRYQFGDQFNYASTLFYLIDLQKVKVLPQLGLAGEVYGANKQFMQYIPGTKGDILFGKLGFELGKDRFSLGINSMLPFVQHLTNGNVKANTRWAFNLNYQL